MIYLLSLIYIFATTNSITLYESMHGSDIVYLIIFWEIIFDRIRHLHCIKSKKTALKKFGLSQILVNLIMIEDSHMIHFYEFQSVSEFL